MLSRRVAVIGLGYVGLPLLLSLHKKGMSAIGFDIDENKVDQLSRGMFPKDLHLPNYNGQLAVSFDEEDLAGSSIYIICVPTPTNSLNEPDLGPLVSACRTISCFLKPGDLVIIESTTFPGCMRDVCIPVLENSGLVSELHVGATVDNSFQVAYSPERINPGDQEKTLEKITKVVSGGSEASRRLVKLLYSEIISAELYEAPSIEVAEFAKAIENAQRDLNIAFMNEIMVLAQAMEIDFWDVWRAAKTKWNFLPFVPGLVGGHCISVDPYYLAMKAKELNCPTDVILAGRARNDSMVSYWAKLFHERATSKGLVEILVLGLTFKENVADFRNSQNLRLARELNSMGLKVSVCDPYLGEFDLTNDQFTIIGINVLPKHLADSRSLVIRAVGHREFSLNPVLGALSDLKQRGRYYDISATATHC